MSEVFSEFCDARRCDTCMYGALYGGYECEQKWLAEHDAKVRAEVLEEYRKWVIDQPFCDISPCDGKCIDCFIRMEKEQKNE